MCLLDARGGGRRPVHSLGRNRTRRFERSAYCDTPYRQSVHMFYQDNILLDSDLHCRIVLDFELTRHSDATATGSVMFSTNFAAPELFAGCIECGKCDCDGRLSGHGIQKTVETDVYAFGCLYYSVSLSIYWLLCLIRLVQIFFNVIPFGKDSTFHRICSLVMSEERPHRLDTPKMEDSTWTLIESCWKPKPSERPKIEQIMSSLRRL